MVGTADEVKKRRIQFTMNGKSDQAPDLAGASRLRISLRQLEVFTAIARAGSTRGAAEKLARSQSAASAALAELEAALEVQLFDRIGRRLVLNENGRALQPGALELLDRAAELQRLFGGEHPAPLRVAASLTIGEYVLPDLVSAWQVQHPNSPVRMAIANSSEVVAAVADLEADIGFIEGPQTHQDLHVKPWFSDELVIVAGAMHPLVAGQPSPRAGLRQLAEASWILREPGSGTRQATDHWLIEHLGSLRIGFELGSTEAIKRLAAAGTGLAALSRHAVARQLADGDLVELQTPLPPARRRLAMVIRRDKRLGRATEDFVRHCLAVAAQAPPPGSKSARPQR